LGCEVLEGRSLLSGGLARFPLPTPPAGESDSVGALTAGPDGNVWFVDGSFSSSLTYTNAIQRITPTGVVSTAVPSADLSGVDVADLATGPDSNVWFAGSRMLGATSEGVVGRITPAGGLTTFTVPGSDDVNNITAGPDGNLWIAATGSNSTLVARVTPHGAITEFPLPQSDDFFSAIAFDGKGNLWVGGNSFSATTEIDTAWIDRMTPSGEVTEYVIRPIHVPAKRGSSAFDEPVQIGGMTAGHDGNVWITEYTYDTDIPSWVVRITPAGKFTRFTAFPRQANEVPGQITAGPGKQLFFSVYDSNFDVPAPQYKIGRITTSGRVSFIRLPDTTNKQGISTGVDALGPLVTGRNGYLWFANGLNAFYGNAAAIDRLTLIGPH